MKGDYFYNGSGNIGATISSSGSVPIAGFSGPSSASESENVWWDSSAARFTFEHSTSHPLLIGLSGEIYIDGGSGLPIQLTHMMKVGVQLYDADATGSDFVVYREPFDIARESLTDWDFNTSRMVRSVANGDTWAIQGFFRWMTGAQSNDAVQFDNVEVAFLRLEL